MLFSEILEFIVKNRDKGRSGAFAFPNEVLLPYVIWAFQRDYLMLTHDGSGITSLIIVAPLDKDFVPSQDKLISFDKFIPIGEENAHPLGVLDFICIDKSEHKRIIDKLLIRFSNFENQQKWAVRFGKPVKISNKYFNHFYNL